MLHLKLHTKTTLLVSAITIAVLAAMMFVISVRMTSLVRNEQKEFTELQARILAEHISNSPDNVNVDELRRSTGLMDRLEPHIVTVRLWEFSQDHFVEHTASPDSLPANQPGEEVKTSLLNNQVFKAEAPVPGNQSNFDFRVFAPYYKHNRLIGAVEVTERLENIPDLVRTYSRLATFIALLSVSLLTAATYLLFRHMIYRPMKRLLYAMARAKAGSLKARAPVIIRDEFGRLSEGFNRMIERIRLMTEEREAQKEVLRERVREATAELQQRNQQLAEANLELWNVSRQLTEMERLAAAGQTAAQFAHEVGTPLNLISCHVELLRGELRTSPDSAEGRTEIISEQIERIERIVRGMLDRTRIEEATLSPLDLNALLRRICDTTTPSLESHGVRLSVDLNPGLPPIAGQPDHLQQVFINLINNALDAMPAGGELNISTAFNVSGRQTGTEPNYNIVVEITDTGCGMAEEVRAHIFDPLYTTKDRGRGTGLGLVIVSQVVREHRGQIEVESSPGTGTTFRLLFPEVDASKTAQGGMATMV